MVVPTQRTHPIAWLDAQGRQGVGQFLDPRVQVPVGHDMEGTVGLPRDNKLRSEDALRMLQNAAHRHGHGHHETVHGLEHPCGEQCCARRGCRDAGAGPGWRGSSWQRVEVPMKLCHCPFISKPPRIQALPCSTGGRAHGDEWSPESPKCGFLKCPVLGQVKGQEVKFALHRRLDAGGCRYGLTRFLTPSPGLVGWPRRVRFRGIRDSTGFEPVSGIRCGAVPPGYRRRSSGRRPPRAVRRRSTVGRSRAPRPAPARLPATGCT